MVPNGYNKAVFYSGSINVVNKQYVGFVATQDTVVEKIGFGVGKGMGALSPHMTVAAGTNIPVKFYNLAATGSILAYTHF
jgi:hypothetical protein|tara:strand:+ start:227 stop:466 length:240 start_codon:yes stop_codon:yes gene_type:complete